MSKHPSKTKILSSCVSGLRVTWDSTAVTSTVSAKCLPNKGQGGKFLREAPLRPAFIHSTNMRVLHAGRPLDRSALVPTRPSQASEENRAMVRDSMFWLNGS